MRPVKIGGKEVSLKVYGDGTSEVVCAVCGQPGTVSDSDPTLVSHPRRYFPCRANPTNAENGRSLT